MKKTFILKYFALALHWIHKESLTYIQLGFNYEIYT